MVKDLYQMGKQMKAGQIHYYQVLLKMEEFGAKKPTTFIRIFYEKTLFPDFAPVTPTKEHPNEFVFFGIPALEIKILPYLEPFLYELYPKSRNLWTTPIFIEFVEKYGIMFRDRLVRLVMNLTRQRRQYKRYFEDCNVLMGEATYTDEKLYEFSSKQLTFDTSVCLTMAINVFFFGQQ